MRLPLSTLEIFDAIAREGSFRAAADALGLQPSTVSHQLKTLEERLGVALFARTTRSVNLTEAGRLLHRGCAPAFDQIDAALQAARDAGGSQRGSLRLTMPGFAYDMFIADKIPSFRAAYPDIELEISLDEMFVNIFEAGFHAGIRLGGAIDPDMIAVRLSPPLDLAVIAHQDYLARHGRPQKPEDLLDHECIRYRFGRSGQIASWDFQGPEGPYPVKVSGNLIVNTLPALYAAVDAGLGLGHVIADYRPAGVSDGVVSLLTHVTIPVGGVYLYYPREYKSRELLRLFVNHIRT